MKRYISIFYFLFLDVSVKQTDNNDKKNNS